VQSITRGDGYVEFTATETNLARALGLSSGAGPDTVYTIEGIDYAVRLGALGNIGIHELGVEVPPPGPNGFGVYGPGDRIRITVTDNLDGTANVAYYLIPAACSAGPSCTGTLLRSAPTPVSYPLRVDASLRNQFATLTRVKMVRIKPL
jgi:hypothetical protein